MRILKLRLANLNSLMGTWEVDFTHPDYVNEGLFAITGPTGAGKSTILDAICLALYGQTPRLGRITKTENDIMSRQAGECWAEVCFATEQGQYRAFWYQHKARKVAEGALQSARHELSELESGKILEEKLSLVPAEITKLSGLDFDRFTRSVLLAQGQFAAFLHADDSQRSALLEQLTGTDIYAQISKLVFQRHKEERDLQTQLKARLGDIRVLSTEEHDELRRQLEAQDTAAVPLEQRLKECEVAAQWVERLQQLQVAQQTLEHESQQLTVERDQFAESQQALDKDQQVRPLAGDIRQRTAYVYELQATLDKIAITEREQAELEDELNALSQTYNHAQQDVTQAKAKQQEAEPRLDEALRLDQALEFSQQRQRELGQDRQRVAHELGTQQALLHTHRESLAQRQTTLSTLVPWLTEHHADQELAPSIAQISAHNEQLQALMDTASQLHGQKQTLREAYREMAQRPSSDEHYQQTERLTQQLTTLHEQQARQQEELQQIKLSQQFAQQRDVLVAGQPCPLCGAHEHPLMDTPHNDDSLVEAHNSIDLQLQQRALEIRQLQDNIQALAVKEAVSSQERTMQLAALQEKGERCQQAIEENAEQRAVLLARWQPLYEQYVGPLHSASEQPLNELLKKLQLAHDKYTEQASEHERLTQQIQQLQHKADEYTRVVARHQAELARIDELSEQINSQLRNQQEARQQLFAGQSVQQVKGVLNEQVRASEQRLAKLAQQLQLCKDRQLSLRTQLQHVQQQHDNTQQRVKELTTQLTRHAEALAYRDLEQMEHALLDERVANEYRAQSQRLEQQWQQMVARRQALTEQIDLAQSKQPRDPHANAQHIEALRAELNELRQNQGALRQRLTEDSAARDKFAAIQNDIERQQLKLNDWSTLNGMIGSQDGKNYRNFAQGLTFAVMIDYANQKLSKMTDRYLLAHDHVQGLALHVIDDYQGGELRSTKNLSGGESFIVSLALALGLAQMASSRVRVDSLFLDEGFGTLDPETLDVALDTLASLRQEGKMIGLISHVGALQDRIATQLHVIPSTGGRSTLAGPGVTARRTSEDT